MPKFVNVGGVWKQQSSEYVNVNGIWKPSTNGYVNVGGVWKGYNTPFGTLLASKEFESSGNMSRDDIVDVVARPNEIHFVCGGSYNTSEGGYVYYTLPRNLSSVNWANESTSYYNQLRLQNDDHYSTTPLIGVNNASIYGGEGDCSMGRYYGSTYKNVYNDYSPSIPCRTRNDFTSFKCGVIGMKQHYEYDLISRDTDTYNPPIIPKTSDMECLADANNNAVLMHIRGSGAGDSFRLYSIYSNSTYGLITQTSASGFRDGIYGVTVNPNRTIIGCSCYYQYVGYDILFFTPYNHTTQYCRITTPHGTILSSKWIDETTVVLLLPDRILKIKVGLSGGTVTSATILNNITITNCHAGTFDEYSNSICTGYAWDNDETLLMRVQRYAI